MTRHEPTLSGIATAIMQSRPSGPLIAKVAAPCCTLCCTYSWRGLSAPRVSGKPGLFPFWARGLAQCRAKGSGVALKAGVRPGDEANRSVWVEHQDARVADHHPAVLDLDGQPDLLGAAGGEVQE